MQYYFPIKPLESHERNGSIQNFGRIDTTIWSIVPNWDSPNMAIRPTRKCLKSVKISRSKGYGRKDGTRFDIELYLRSCPSSSGFKDYYDYGESSVFNNDIFSKNCKATIFQNHKYRDISTDLYCDPGFEVRGYIVIRSSSHCDDKTEAACITSCNIPSEPELSNDFLCLLDNPNSFADATLKCETAEIPVHKCVLSVRSPVLAAMLTSLMQEGLSSTILITDIKLDVLQATLRYIYGGKTDNLTDVLAGDMLYAADKYQLDKLKLICIAKLKSRVTKENVFRILILGELHDKGLKTHAIGFLCRYDRFSDLEATEEWGTLEKKYPKLAIEVLKSIVEFVQQTKNGAYGDCKRDKYDRYSEDEYGPDPDEYDDDILEDDYGCFVDAW